MEFDTQFYNMLCKVSTQLDKITKDGYVEVHHSTPVLPAPQTNDKDERARARITSQINKESAESKLASLRSTASLGKTFVFAGLVDVMSNGIIGSLFDTYVTSGLAMVVGVALAAIGIKMIPERSEVEVQKDKLIAASAWNYYESERILNEKELPPST